MLVVGVAAVVWLVKTSGFFLGGSSQKETRGLK
jgi:hypothetical protein